MRHSKTAGQDDGQGRMVLLFARKARMFLVLALTVVLLPGCIPARALITEPETHKSKGFTYTLNEDGSATIVKAAESKKITIPAKLGGHPVTGIGGSAFEPGSILKSMSVPAGVTNIAEGAFANCSNLTSISVSKENACYEQIGGVLFDKRTNTLHTYPAGSTAETYEIPEGIKSIGASAFAGANLKSVSIPDSVTSIGFAAFASCDSLTGISIPDSVTYMGLYAFFNCSAMTSIKIPRGVTAIEYEAFASCSSLKEVTIPDSVLRIGVGAFFYCESLESITIPDSVDTIADAAFSQCFSLKDFAMPDSLTYIGPKAFDYCSSLTDITIPAGVTGIGEGAFSFCRSLISIGVAEGNTCFESRDGVLFDKNTKVLLAYPIGKTAETYGIPEGTARIGAWAFSDCQSLKNVSVPDSLTSIGDGAFLSCRSLKDITLPPSVEDFGSRVFDNCLNLTVKCTEGSAAKRYLEANGYR